jgi:hypothetical protein
MALACAACVVALGVGGCGRGQVKPVDFAETTREYRPSDYLPTYAAWTRSARLVRDVGTVVEAWATYKSWDFRQAYVAYYSQAYGLPDVDRAALAESQRETSRSMYEFHLVFQTSADRWNDLERRASPWRISLVDGTGAELSPNAITLVKLPDLYESQFFPARTEFSRSYAITFPRTAGEAEGFVGPASGRITLRIASPAGRVDMTWDAR